MDMNAITSAVSSVGFPIVMCLILAWYVKYMSEKHKEETEKFTDALNSNTLVLQKLCDAMDVERGD